MTPAATVRNAHATAISRSLGMFVILWLNMALQPCAMAMGGERECPHCPPVQEDRMAAHHGQSDDETDACCVSLQTDCSDVDEFSVDGRQAQNKLKDKADFALAVPPSVPQASLDPIGFSTTAADPPRPWASSRPLHVLHCVFLD